MSELDLKPLLSSAPLPPRLLVEAKLKPIQGKRFQPTGFPDLGAAQFDGGNRLLVESAQSMANRLERTIWDESTQELIAPAKGLSYVRVEDKKGAFMTSTILEAHRLSSAYVLDAANGKTSFMDRLKEELAGFAKGPVDRRALAKAVVRYDVNALLHGLFLAHSDLAGGRLRIERALTSFIEAEGVEVAASGGVKNDHVDPSGKLGGGAKEGFGNVPFQRDEYTAARITAFFSLDLHELRAYGLGQDGEALLVTLGLYKIASLLSGDLRLRTACDLELAESPKVTRPEGFALPSVASLAAALPGLIKKCAPLFAEKDGTVRLQWAKA